MPDDATVDAKYSRQDIGVQFLKDAVQMPAQQPVQAQARAAELPAATNIAGSDNSGPSTIKTEASADLSDEGDEPSADDWIFEGGSGSLVAHAVGSAEGTRQWDGEQTRAYYGHRDPGNGVWNLGTFSYQHEATSPEDADEKQIKRLKAQGFELEEQASQQGVRLTLPEKLNGLDLANQAPLAALGKGGYIEQLAQAHQLQLQDEAAIAWARTQAYKDPDTKLWNAPGLGNNAYSISQDQERRMSAISQALGAYRQTTSLDDLAPDDLASDDLPLEDLAKAFKLSDRSTEPSQATDRQYL
ncbi:MAG: hypothetical protein WBA76_01915 [Phormidesmis sp.]